MNHDPSHSYVPQLLGIRQIPHSYDADKAMQAIDEFRNPSRAVRGKPAVYLHVSAQGLKLIDDDWVRLSSSRKVILSPC